MSKKTQPDNKFVPNVKNLPLTEYFKTLPKAVRRPVIYSSPKKELVDAIAEATQRDPHSVKRWMYGYAAPSSLIEKKIVADMLGSSVEILFPARESAGI
ncbi:hypothetical protein [Bacteroides sp. 51]|uniref:hypothetical protein n=1 Tax=Bacteroides sp. 51 TaxID=2302938 RepID=UPI0013D127DD|nr:hypothetical protein [Bacteroides sp. 51]NDV81290.1 hypothetical protein [Bacteroides sp. 51]